MFVGVPSFFHDGECLSMDGIVNQHGFRFIYGFLFTVLSTLTYLRVQSYGIFTAELGLMFLFMI